MPTPTTLFSQEMFKPLQGHEPALLRFKKFGNQEGSIDELVRVEVFPQKDWRQFSMLSETAECFRTPIFQQQK